MRYEISFRWNLDSCIHVKFLFDIGLVATSRDIIQKFRGSVDHPQMALERYTQCSVAGIFCVTKSVTGTKFL